MKKCILFFNVILFIVMLTGCGSDTEETQNASNQSVYKTIDFTSYSGDSNSTEFDDLEGKKVTFTNVTVLGGYLGNMVKMISCDNSSSYSLENTLDTGAEYTVTGIVKSVLGTYSVSMKDCTITKE